MRFTSDEKFEYSVLDHMGAIFFNSQNPLYHSSELDRPHQYESGPNMSPEIVLKSLFQRDSVQ